MDKETLFTRRSIILGGLQTALMTTVVGRMFYLEVLSNTHYQKLSNKNRIHSRLTLPIRGFITDQTGKILASDHTVYRAVMIRDEADDWKVCLKRVQKLLQLTIDEADKIALQLRKRPRFVPVAIKENLSWQEVSILELHLPDIAGIFIEEGRNRYYPYPLETCHFLGYVATPSEKELDGDPLLEQPGFKLGKTGLEKTLESPLRGTPGIKQVEVNAFRRVVRELSTSESIHGQEQKLTLNFELQKTLYQRLLQEESGAAVVLDIKTGGVLAYVSTPGFDTNLFVNGIPKKDWQDLLNHPRHALVNKPISGLYAPGSTFKMITALAALEKGVVTPQTIVPCSGHLMLRNHKFHCWTWKTGGHGAVDLVRAIATSCDIYFYHIASLVGIDAIAAMAKRLGLGTPTGIELPGEKRGLVPTVDWKRQTHKEKWTMGDTYNAGIGQGYILATPLQLSVMIARLACGQAVSPTLLRGEDHGQKFTPLEIPLPHLEAIQTGLNKASNEGGGTSFNHRITQPGFEMAGKTGTTQVRRITERERELGIVNSSDRPWHHREHALFVGYAPVQAPRYAAAALIEHGGSGGRVAAPVGRDVLWAAQQLLET
jgi:penicillin-binding protein 2